jgi:3-oxoadipate enol-lactonase
MSLPAREQPAAAVRRPAGGRHPASAEVTLAFDQLGDGPVAVALLHGVGGGRAIWGDSASATTRAVAAAGFSAIAVDLPGYGDSPLPPDLSVATMAQSVAATLRELGLREAVLVGHSMGGMVALELAASHPGVVRGLVLACTSPAFGSPGGAWQRDFLRDRLSLLEGRKGMAGLAATLVPGMAAPGTDEGVIACACAVMAAVPEATYRAALAALVAFDRRAALAGIRVPTLCLAGEHDRTAPPELMLRMAERIPGAQYACVPAAGHVVNVEQPSAFNDALVSFLKRNFA